MEKHGTDAMVWTLRVLTETNPANARQLNCEMITAVNAVCRLKRWTLLGLAFLDAFDAIDLGELRRLAISFGLSNQPLWATMAALIIDHLQPVLDPPVLKPKCNNVIRLQRRQKSCRRLIRVEKNMALGMALIALRTRIKSNRAFGRAVRSQFDVDPMHAVECKRAARAYGDRPDIYCRLSWNALVLLSSPTLPARARQHLEARILAGEKIVATDIIRARQAHAERSHRRMAA